MQARSLGRRGSLQPLDLTIRSGEVLGLAGLLGSGRTEAARLLSGADRADSGEIRLDDAPLRLHSPRDALNAGIAFCPEERKTEGIVAELSCARTSCWHCRPSRCVPPSRAPASSALAERYIAALGIKTADAETPIGQLSGGNQQKAMLARWLATQPRLLILDEPTRGIDVAAKQEIMERVLALCREEGLAMLFISAELEEVLRVSDTHRWCCATAAGGETAGRDADEKVCSHDCRP
jgi:monosaccharide-transporting ATPase